MTHPPGSLQVSLPQHVRRLISLPRMHFNDRDRAVMMLIMAMPPRSSLGLGHGGPAAVRSSAAESTLLQAHDLCSIDTSDPPVSAQIQLRSSASSGCTSPIGGSLASDGRFRCKDTSSYRGQDSSVLVCEVPACTGTECVMHGLGPVCITFNGLSLTILGVYPG